MLRNCLILNRLYMLPRIFLVAMGIFIGSSFAEEGADDDSLKIRFEKEFQDWVQYGLENPYLSTYTTNKEFYDIIELGIPAIPYMIEKMEEGSYNLGVAISIITMKRFEITDYIDSTKRGDTITKSQMYIQWWNEERGKTTQLFDSLYGKWKNLKETGKDSLSAEMYKKIVRLGIIALPYIMDKIAEGENEFVPAIIKLSKGNLHADATSDKCIQWWQENKEKWYIPIEDEPIEKEQRKIKKNEKE